MAIEPNTSEDLLTDPATEAGRACFEEGGRSEEIRERHNCWNCNKRRATEPPPNAAQFTRDTTRGLCDECRAIALGQPISLDCLVASAEDWPENLY